MSSTVAKPGTRGFARIHRSAGVNLDYVESITPQDSGDAVVTLRGGAKLTLSRHDRDGFRQFFNEAANGSP